MRDKPEKKSLNEWGVSRLLFGGGRVADIWVTYETNETNFRRFGREGKRAGAKNSNDCTVEQLTYRFKGILVWDIIALSASAWLILAFYAMGLRGNDITNNLWCIRTRWDCPRDLYISMRPTIFNNNKHIACDIIEIYVRIVRNPNVGKWSPRLKQILFVRVDSRYGNYPKK